MPRHILLAFLFVASVSPVQATDEPTQRKVDHPVSCLAVSPDGKTIIVGGPQKKIDFTDPASIFQPGKVTILDAATGKVLRTLPVDHSAMAVAISPDGKRLLTGTLSRGGVIQVGKKASVFPRTWDIATGKPLLELDGHNDMVKGAAFFPDGKRMITASGDGTARIWDADTGKELLVLKTGFFNDGLALSRDGKHVAINSGNTKLTIWHAETGKEVFVLNVGYSATNSAFSPDGSLIAVCSSGVNDITLWDGKSGARTGSIVVGFDREKNILVARNVTSNLVFSPDGKWLVTGNGEGGDDDKGEVTIWDVAGKKKHAELKGHTSHIRAVAFTPDGKTLISASADGAVLLWDFATAVKAREKPRRE
jgi:WD40 repeat protein